MLMFSLRLSATHENQFLLELKTVLGERFQNCFCPRSVQLNDSLGLRTSCSNLVTSCKDLVYFESLSFFKKKKQNKTSWLLIVLVLRQLYQLLN